jgi:hypothetical protein
MQIVKQNGGRGLGRAEDPFGKRRRRPIDLNELREEKR